MVVRKRSTRRKASKLTKVFRGNYAKILPSFQDLLEHAVYNLEPLEVAKAFRIPLEAAEELIDEASDEVGWSDLDDTEPTADWIERWQRENAE